MKSNVTTPFALDMPPCNVHAVIDGLNCSCPFRQFIDSITWGLWEIEVETTKSRPSR